MCSENTRANSRGKEEDGMSQKIADGGILGKLRNNDFKPVIELSVEGMCKALADAGMRFVYNRRTSDIFFNPKNDQDDLWNVVLDINGTLAVIDGDAQLLFATDTYEEVIRRASKIE